VTRSNTVYSWRPKAHRSGVDAQEVGETLEALAVNGLLHPQAIVEAAKPARSPLHRLFEWDDAVAGAAYRVDQARAVVQSLQVEIVTKDGEVREGVRAFVNIVTRTGEQGYAGIMWAASDKDVMRGLLAKALDELNSWRRRYGDLVELARVNDVLDETIAALELARLEAELQNEPEPV
jgi:hypothetical protein